MGRFADVDDDEWQAQKEYTKSPQYKLGKATSNLDKALHNFAPGAAVFDPYKEDTPYVNMNAEGPLPSGYQLDTHSYPVRPEKEARWFVPTRESIESFKYKYNDKKSRKNKPPIGTEPDNLVEKNPKYHGKYSDSRPDEYNMKQIGKDMTDDIRLPPNVIQALLNWEV